MKDNNRATAVMVKKPIGEIQNAIISTDNMQQAIEDIGLTEIYTTEEGVWVVAAWNKDEGTKEKRLILSLLDSKGEFSPFLEYKKSKLGSEKVFQDLLDMDGIGEEDIPKIYKGFREKQATLTEKVGGEGKCSLTEAYLALCEYVTEFMEPGLAFIKDGYGFILASYLPTVLDRLSIGYGKLELQKNFKALNLLQVNNGTMHPYSYKVKDKWYFSFRLPKQEVAVA